MVWSQFKIESYWSLMLRFECKHNFYKNNYCPDLKFVPTDETKISLNNLRLILKEQEHGFVLLYDKDQSLKLLNSEVNRPHKLSFVIRNENYRFLNISKLPFVKDDKIYYFSNKSGKADKDQLKLIHKSDFVEHTEENRIPLRPWTFDYEFSKPTSFLDFDIINPEGKKLKKPDLEEKFAKAKHNYQHIDLRYMPSGRYTIQSKGEKDFSFYLMPSWDDKIFGVVDIFFDDIQKDLVLFDKKEIKYQEYGIQFETRNTNWKYILIDQNDGTKADPIEDVKVSLFDEQIKFTKPEKIRLTTGKEAHVIESIDEIPSEEWTTSQVKLEMKIKKKNKWSVRTYKLPKPGIDLIKPDRQKNKVYSVVYYYL